MFSRPCEKFKLGQSHGYVRFKEKDAARLCVEAMQSRTIPLRIGGATPSWQVLTEAEVASYYQDANAVFRQENPRSFVMDGFVVKDKPRMSMQALNSEFSRVPIDMFPKLYMEFDHYPNFINQMHIGNIWNKLGRHFGSNGFGGRSARANVTQQATSWFESQREFRDCLLEATTRLCDASSEERLQSRTLSNSLNGLAKCGLQGHKAAHEMVATLAATLSDMVAPGSNLRPALVVPAVHRPGGTHLLVISPCSREALPSRLLAASLRLPGARPV